MVIDEYIKLKKRIKKLEKLPIDDPQRQELEGCRRTMQVLDKNDIIYNFKRYSMELTHVKKQIGSWMRHGKDTAELIEKQAVIEKKIVDLTMPSMEASMVPMETPMENSPEAPKVPPEAPYGTRIDMEVLELLRSINEKVTKDSQPSQDPSYYMINLAWSKEDGFIINTIRDFLSMSNYIQSIHEPESVRGETILTWKFYYDTIEEQASVKSTLAAADHLLEVMKSRYPGQTDAEVFGKIQKY